MNYAEHYLFAIFFAKQHQQFCTFCQLRVLVHTDPKKFQKLVAISIGNVCINQKKIYLNLLTTQMVLAEIFVSV